MHRTATRLAAVRPFKCHECSAVGETTYATHRGQRLREHTFCMRWCGACWSNHMSSSEAPGPTVEQEKPVLAVLVPKKPPSTVESGAPSEQEKPVLAVVVQKKPPSAAESGAPSAGDCRWFAGDALATAENGGWVCDVCVRRNYIDQEAPPLQSACRIACSLCRTVAPHLDDNPWRSFR